MAGYDEEAKDNTPERFSAFFTDATGFSPYEWQVEIAIKGLDGVLPIPTGLGKTEGTALAWAWRFATADEPRHLVYCLPMRTLVRQTVERLRTCFRNLQRTRSLDISVYQLMGGAIDEEWARFPEKPWMLVGTQDQLLSRALNRGYAMSRFAWPVHFGLVNNDCRWVIDETQLMGPGLWTTAQLDWMRQKRFACLKPCRTTWMSATVGSGFLETTDRKRDGLADVSLLDPPLDSDPHPEMTMRRGAMRAVHWLANGSDVASTVTQDHQPGTLSLVVCNTVDEARKVFGALPDSPPKILLTSRFRRQDRAQHEQRLFEFEEKRREHGGREIPDDPGLICISTQVVEAGVDISAHRLWSELAPWPSVIQRLGRLNRDGRDQEAKAWFWETTLKGKRRKGQESIGPYAAPEIQQAKTLLEALIPLATGKPFAEAMEKLARQKADDFGKALKPKLAPMPRALDVHELFSTERDVHGGFTDVSAFVRGTDPDADLTVFWREWDPGKGGRRAPPHGDALDGPSLDIRHEGCAVPFFRLRAFLDSLRAPGWVWNDEDEEWERVLPRELRPGMIVMLHRGVGGYDTRLGWTDDTSHLPDDVPRAGRGRALPDDERAETGSWVRVSVHLEDAKRAAQRLCDDLGIDGPFRTAVVEAAALHDLGKAHPQWQQAVPAVPPNANGPWAKFPPMLAVDVRPADERTVRTEVTERLTSAPALPDEVRRRGRDEYIRLRWVVATKLKRNELDDLKKLAGVRWAGHVPFRPGMRHEAASALAMWARYRKGRAPYPALSAYLVAAHHGKVRTVLRATADAGNDAFGVSSDSAALDVLGAQWPLDFSVATDGAQGEWRDGDFVLTGYGWTGLVADLLGPWGADDATEVGAIPESEPRRLGPFALAYLEVLVRVADWRASENPSESLSPDEVRLDR